MLAVFVLTGRDAGGGSQVPLQQPGRPARPFHDAELSRDGAGKVHYFIGGGNGSFIGSTQGGTTTAYQIQEWVTSTFASTTIGGTTVYDLTGGTTVS